MHGDPFRVVVNASLVGLYFQGLDVFWNWLTVVGACFGVVFLVFGFGAIYGVIDGKKNKHFQGQSAERLKQHQARFYCHICGKPSPNPYQYWDQYGENGQLYSESFVTDYNKPTELVQCTQCQKWTCDNAEPPHLENGICKKCLGKPHQHV